MKECGTCTICCDGWLLAKSYGNPFGNGRTCVFLCDSMCSIYSTRPTVCRNYQCAWSQGLFPNWMKPTESKVLVSVQTAGVKQYLKVVELGVPISERVLTFIKEWVNQNETYYVLIKYNDGDNKCLKD